MNIRELRIGNNILFQNRIVKIEGLNISLNNTDEVIILDKDNCRAACTMEHIKPILLTEDIIKKIIVSNTQSLSDYLSDESLDYHNVYSPNGEVLRRIPANMTIEQKTEEWKECIDKSNKNYEGCSIVGRLIKTIQFPNDECRGLQSEAKINIPYLHILQNLYFLMYNKELEVEL